MASQLTSNMPEPGGVIGDKYVVERTLGRGGMGVVYVVSHKVTGKRLALKCLLAEHLEDHDIVDRFLREAQAAGRIQHRHVVDVFDVGQDGSSLYMVMPLLEGKPLSSLLKEDGLTLEELLGICARAMEGVGAAHAQGIVHRDLKPDNIFVCIGPSGRLDDPRVLDFGISKRNDDVSAPLTRSGVMMGTPYYMSFEQINSQRDLDARVDIYAMGVILYEAISGSLPHVAESIGQLAIRMMSRMPQHLGTLRPDLPDGLADVIMKAIARDRDDRFSTMHDFVDALRPYHNQGRSSLLPDGPGTPLRSHMDSPLPPRRAGGEEPTVRSSEVHSDVRQRFHSPVPQELRVTAHDQQRPHRMLRMLKDVAPPRIIGGRSSSGWIWALLLLAAGVGAFVFFSQPSSSMGAPGQPAAAGPVAPVEPAPEANEARPSAQPPQAAANEAEQQAEQQAEPAPAAEGEEVVAPPEGSDDKAADKKHHHKRRKVVRTTTTPSGAHKQVVLFIDDDEADKAGGTWGSDEAASENPTNPTNKADSPAPAASDSDKPKAEPDVKPEKADPAP